MYKNAIIILLGILLALAVGYILMNPSLIENRSKLRLCPDAWIENRMPTIGGQSGGNQYFILNGDRRELSEFDVDWIIENCPVNEPSPVY